MGKILVCQHVAYEPLGTLNPLIKDFGLRIRYINFGRKPDAKPGVEGYKALILLGGPMNTDQADQFPHIHHEIKMVEEALKKDIPILGICLGAQIIAKTLGAEVKRNPEKEIGWYKIKTADSKDDPVFRHFHPEEWIFQWHGDTFQIPKGAVRLATSDSCSNQAFRYGNNIYGLQFHMEADEALIERWLEVPGHIRELEALQGKIDPENIRDMTPARIQRMKELSQLSFSEFLKIFTEEKKFRCPPSR